MTRLTTRDAVLRASTQIARRDGELLLGHVLGRDRTWLLAHPEALLTEVEATAFETLVVRRAAHEPLQYLTGRQEFFGLDLRVTPAVLIPRPETEVLVEAVLAWAKEQPGPLRLVDVGTGSGAIALALATHLPGSEVVSVDISAAALAVARENVVRLGLGARVRFLESDLLSALQPEIDQGSLFDAVVSNPPYVSEGDAPTMQPEVRDFEPHTALFAGADGLSAYRRLIPEAWAALRPGGLLALEIGFGQRDGLTRLLNEWAKVRFVEDLAGIPRVALAERP